MTSSDAQLITVEDAARLLGKSQRTVYRYAEQGRLVVHDTPHGKLFERGAVEALAAELNITPQLVQPVTELVPLSDMLAELHRKDDQLAAAHEKLQAAAHENGRLRERLDMQQRALTDADMTRQRVIDLERQNAQLQAELEAARQLTQHTPAPSEPAPDAEPTPQAADQPAKRVPWWRRLFADI